MTLIVAFAGLLALQIWRPLYHLTDDNLDGCLPVYVEFSKRLWSGQNPFVSDALFGGGYKYLADAGALGLIGPFVLLATPLACTRWYYLVPDVVASANLMVVAIAFCWSGLRIRRALKLQITDEALAFLSVSYAFSAFNLVVNPSWIGFINPQPAMPGIIAALYEQKRWVSIAMIVGGALFSLVGSHLHPFIFMCFFVGGLSLVVAIHQRSYEPLFRLAAGVGIAVLIVAPLLVPATVGFSTSQRQAALDPRDAMLSRLPAAQLAASAILGPAAAPLFPTMYVHSADPTFSTAIAFSLINLPVLWLLVRKRRFSILELGIGVLVLTAVLLIVRPLWLETVMLKIPLFRSLRWPFREVADLNFLLHLFALLNFGALFGSKTRWGVAAGTCSFAVIFLGAVPTFSPMDIDRHLVISGKAADFWQMLTRRIGEKPRVIVAAPPQLVLGRQIQHAPYSLLGAFNYAALLGFVNVSGYSPTQAGSAITDGVRPYHFGGIYWPRQAERVWQQHPELTLMELLNNSPGIIRVRHHNQMWVFSYDERTDELRDLTSPEADRQHDAGSEAAR